MSDDKRKTYLYDPSGGKITKRLFAVLVSLVGWILRPLLRDVDRGYAEEAFRREMRRHEPHEFEVGANPEACDYCGQAPAHKVHTALHKRVSDGWNREK